MQSFAGNWRTYGHGPGRADVAGRADAAQPADAAGRADAAQPADAAGRADAAQPADAAGRADAAAYAGRPTPVGLRDQAHEIGPA
ncbi:hypothetical protein [Microbacterium hatanonis]|uniref:Uncharacterized protein n=1 Tax=Microbacterium hatanonis TaxID=404366 RepID=A0A5C8I4L5_9MICO|nr:hypothetical protein [Microbacterium hatanonis]TXK13636.1 hypothetical protein FVP77_09730 [Microbacterium hatanonis]